MQSILRFWPILLLAALTACHKQTRPDPDVLARVGDREIRVSDLRAELARRGATGNGLADAETALEDLVRKEALFAAALAKGLDRDPEVQRTWKNLLIGKLKERELQPRIDTAQISAQEIQDHYQRNLARYTKPAQVRLALLHLRTYPNMSDDKRAFLESRMAEARQRALELPPKTADFGPLAVDYSEDQATRYKGGDIGWLNADVQQYRWDPQVLTTGMALPKTGAVSDVIHAKDGLYLVKLVDRRGSEITALKEVESAAKHQLLLQKREQLEQAFVQQARQSTRVVVEHERLKQFEGSPTAPEQSAESMPSMAAWPGGKAP